MSVLHHHMCHQSLFKIKSNICLSRVSIIHFFSFPLGMHYSASALPQLHSVPHPTHIIGIGLTSSPPILHTHISFIFISWRFSFNIFNDCFLLTLWFYIFCWLIGLLVVPVRLLNYKLALWECHFASGTKNTYKNTTTLIIMWKMDLLLLNNT